MTWQHGARGLLAVIGLGTAISLYVLTHKRPESTAPPIPASTDPAAVTQSADCVYVRSVGAVERWRLECGEQKVFADQHIEWRHVHITFHDDGTEVWADTAKVIGPPKGGQVPAALALGGHVRLRTGEGATVEGESATYDDAAGLTNMPGPITFTRGRMSGAGTGATFEREAGVFRVLADAHMTTTAEPSHPDAVDATAATLVFNRATQAMQFDTGARIAHGSDVMTGDRATLYLSDDQQQFRVIELRGNARVAPDAGRPSDTPAMHAQDIDLAFHEGTQILQHAVLRQQASMAVTNPDGQKSVSGDVVTFDTASDGKTLTALEATQNVVVTTPGSKDGPGRRITATSLLATGESNVGLTSAVFSGGITFSETTGAPGGRPTSGRTGTAQTLTLALKGQLDAIDRADFQRKVEFIDGNVRGHGDIGTYYASQGRLTLKPEPSSRVPTEVDVTTGELTVWARTQIDVDLSSHDVSATGEVRTASKPAKGTTASGALFNGTDTIIGTGARFDYDNAAGRAVYQGTMSKTAQVRQGAQSVQGVKVELVDATQDLTATGNVESVFLLAGETGAKPAQYKMTGDAMVYKDGARVVTYTGKPAVMKTPDANNEAGTIVLTLAKEGRNITHLTLRSQAYARLPENRQLLADQVDYDAATEVYEFGGKENAEAVLRTQDASGKCTETNTIAGRMGKNDQAPNFSGGRGFVPSHEVPCSSPFRR